MNLTNNIDSIPPCGIDCTQCPKYLREKNSCSGYPEGCRKCKTLYVCCVEKRGHEYCFQCSSYPCARFTKFAKSWEKLGQDLFSNQQKMKNHLKHNSSK